LEINQLENALQNIPNLVSKIESGDRQAEDELARHFAPTVRVILLKRTRNPQLANDLCQDTFVVALRRLRAGELRKPEALSAFIHQIAVNLSIEHYRYEKRFVSVEDEIISIHSAHRDRKGQDIDHEKARGLIDRALSELGMPRDREILRRFFLQDEDKQSICVALELSSEHFDRVLFRAKQRMRKLIEQQTELKTLLLGSYLDG
jgi:RNA polymerase sigma-70 factor (ECF subfamily)